MRRNQGLAARRLVTAACDVPLSRVDSATRAPTPEPAGVRGAGPAGGDGVGAQGLLGLVGYMEPHLDLVPFGERFAEGRWIGAGWSTGRARPPLDDG